MNPFIPFLLLFIAFPRGGRFFYEKNAQSAVLVEPLIGEAQAVSSGSAVVYLISSMAKLDEKAAR